MSLESDHRPDPLFPCNRENHDESVIYYILVLRLHNCGPNLTLS